MDFSPPHWVEAIGRWAAVSVAIAIPSWWLIKTAVASVVRPMIERSDMKLEKHMLDEITMRKEERDSFAEARSELVEAVEANQEEIIKTREQVMEAVAGVDVRVAVIEGHVGLFNRR